MDLLAGKQGATASRISGFALVQSTVVTFLCSSVLGKFFRVNFGGVGCIT